MNEDAIFKKHQIQKNQKIKQKECSQAALRRSLTRQATISIIANKEGYEFSSKIVIYDGKSLYLFDHKTTFRRVIVGISEAKAFDMFVLLLILINSAGMIIYDYNDRENKEPYNQVLE